MTCQQPRRFAVTALPAACLAIMLFTTAGCHVEEHKGPNGKSDDVNISTPFGGMHVNTGDKADTSAIGLTAYPGATPVKDDDGKDSGAADVNMSFGSFHLGVKATSLQTADSQEKVLAFYRKDMARYGAVIECRGHETVGSPASTADGLSCKDDDSHSSSTTTMSGGSFKTTTSSDNLELRAGSLGHQHIVGVEARNGGTKIGLVLLDLPAHGKNAE